MHIQVRVYVTPEFHGIPGVAVGVASSGDASRPTTKTDSRGMATITLPRTGRIVSPSSNRLSDDSFVITLFNQMGGVVLSRRYSVSSLRRRSISIPLSYRQAVDTRLLMNKGRRSLSEKKGDLCDRWKKAGSRKELRSDLSLCFGREVMQIATGDSALSSQLEEQLLKSVESKMTRKELNQARELVRQARENMADCWPKKCPGGDENDWVRDLFMLPDAPGSGLVKHLKSATPNPSLNPGEVRAGPGIGIPVDIGKTCLERLEQHELPDDDSQELERIVSGEITRLARPSINLVEVWAPDPWAEDSTGPGSVVRLGQVWEELLTVSERLLLDSASTTVDTNVELDSPDCLILEANDQGMQRFFVDVKPGQVISLKGSGFVSPKVRISIRFRRLDEGDGSELLSFLDDWESHSGFELMEMDVHGSALEPAANTDPTDSSMDKIVFRWPEVAATPGLYKLDLSFQNESRHHVDVIVDPDTCEVELVKDGIVSTQSIYLVVPPDLEQAAVRMRATTVDCQDETDPEALIINLADDTSYKVSGSHFGMRLKDANASSAAGMFAFEELSQSILAEGSRRFWDAPDSWTANLQAFPESALAVLPHDEMIMMTMNLFEIDSELDQVIIRASLVIVLVSLVLLTFLVMAALIVTLIATGVVSVASFGAGTALTVIVAAITAAMTGVFFGAIMAVIAAIVAVVPSTEIIASGATSFSGLELAHRLSGKRIHRIVWPAERPLVEDASVNTRRLSSNINNDGYEEVFRADNLGGRYDLTAAIHTE